MNFSKRLEQDQDVELLVAKDKKYNFKCRNGNWPCEELLEKVSGSSSRAVITKLPFLIFPSSFAVVIRVVFN